MIVYVTREQALGLIDKVISAEYDSGNDVWHPEDIFGLVGHVAKTLEIALSQNEGVSKHE